MLKFVVLGKRVKNLHAIVFFFRNKPTEFLQISCQNICLPVVLDALLQIMTQFNVKASLKDRDVDPSSLHIIRVWELCRSKF